MQTKYPGLLSEQQLAAIARAQQFLPKLAKSMADLNTILVNDQRLPVHPLALPQYEAGRLLHELEELVFNHDLAMAKWRRDVAAGAERMAA